MQRAKEEQEKREEEEYLRLKASFTVEDQGEEEQLTEDQVTSLLSSYHLNIPFSVFFKNNDNKCLFSFLTVTQPFARIHPVHRGES